MAEQNPESILPEELWIAVLNNLKDPNDLMRCCATCVLWKSLFYKNRTTWMFPSAFAHLFNFLPKQDILNARLVCKQWNHGITSFLEQDQPYLKSTSQRRDYKVRALEVDLNFTAHRLGISLLQTLQMFESQFGNKTEKNPFLSRSLFLDIEELSYEYLQWFDKYGKFLRSLSIYIIRPYNRERSCPLEMAQYIWQLLSSVPNLKRLKLWALGNRMQVYFQKEVLEESSHRQELLSFLDKHPVPNLPDLRMLEMFVTFRPIQDKLEAKYVPQLNWYKHDRIYPIQNENFENIRELIWTVGLCYNNKHQLTILQNIKAPLLEKIGIDIYPQRNKTVCVEDPCGPELFKVLEKFQTLKSVNIYWSSWGTHLPPRLDLPNLKEMCLEFNCSLLAPETDFSLGFLGSIKTLVKLTCIFDMRQYNRARKVKLEGIFVKEKCEHVIQAWKNVQINECADLENFLDPIEQVLGKYPLSQTPYKCQLSQTPYKSNIWKLCPSLQKLEIGIVEQDPFWLLKRFPYRWEQFEKLKTRKLLYFYKKLQIPEN